MTGEVLSTERANDFKLETAPSLVWGTSPVLFKACHGHHAF